MTDRDGDSHMRNLDDSGSEHSSRASSLFPNESATTPPQSQLQQQHSNNIMTTGQREDTLMEEAGEHAGQEHHFNTTGSQGIASGNPRSRKLDDAFETDENAPGYPWQCRRAVEEYEKVQMILLDQDFSLRDFGDPILEQLQAQEPGLDVQSQLG